MANSVYDFIATKNARLAKFTDNHPQFAEAMMRMVLNFEQVARQRGRDLNDLDFECMAAPDGSAFVVKLRKK